MTMNAIKVCEILQNNGFSAYFVGGCVRDKFLEQPIHDIDITTNAKPEEIQKLFPMHIDTGLKHGTVSVKPIEESEYFEVTTYRIDGEYKDGRHPDSVEFVNDLTSDLARRDFTINAMAFNPINDSLYDPFGGLKDIENKWIHCVGNAKDRFMEDPLRVLRAMRFAIKLGFTITVNTKMAMHDPEVLDKLANCISKERITDELRKMLTCGKPVHDIFMEFSDIISIIIPEIKDCVNAPHNSPWHKHDIFEHILYVVDNCETTKFEIKLAALLHDIGKPKCRIQDENDPTIDHFNGHPKISVELAEQTFKNSLKLSNKEAELTLKLIEKHDIHVEPTDKFIKRFINRTSIDFIRDLIILKAADIKDHICAPDKQDKWNDLNYRFMVFAHNFENFLILNDNTFTIKDLKINGNDIMQILNIKPSPKIGKILNELLDDIIEDRLDNDRDELLNIVKIRYA